MVCYYPILSASLHPQGGFFLPPARVSGPEGRGGENVGRHVKAQVMDAVAMQRGLRRIAHEILERNRGATDLVLIGIRTRGVPLAQRLGAHLAQIEGHS